jgi:hypothetical protein
MCVLRLRVGLKCPLPLRAQVYKDHVLPSEAIREREFFKWMRKQVRGGVVGRLGGWAVRDVPCSSPHPCLRALPHRLMQTHPPRSFTRSAGHLLQGPPGEGQGAGATALIPMSCEPAALQPAAFPRGAQVARPRPPPASAPGHFTSQAGSSLARVVAAQDLESVFDAADEAQKREMLDALRQLHAAVDPDRVRTHSQATHCEMTNIQVRLFGASPQSIKSMFCDVKVASRARRSLQPGGPDVRGTVAAASTAANCAVSSLTRSPRRLPPP